MDKSTPADKLRNLPLALFLMGPTASGKTDLALILSKHWPVEVISVDSALIYRGMDIGTAKPDSALLAELPHFLIDILDPDASYSAAQFRRDAMALMADIVARGNIPLLVGGTMLYYKALLEGMEGLPKTDARIRQQVAAEAAAIGWPAMHQKLQAVDPVSASAIHPNHSQRIQRALEVYYGAGEPLSAIHARQTPAGLPYRVLQFALSPTNRNQLHERIAQRCEQMLAGGFIQELRDLRSNFSLQSDMMSMRAVGYRQAWLFLDGQISHEELVTSGQAATRQLAKRQLTWLRKWPDVQKLPIDYRDSGTLTSAIDQINSQISRLIN